MLDFFFDTAPECLVITDLTSKIIFSNEKFDNIFSKDLGDSSFLYDINFYNQSDENIFVVNKMKNYFEFDFENRELMFRNVDGYKFNFLLSSRKIKLNDKVCLFLSFKNITDIVSYKNIFEDLYNNLSVKTIELDNVISEKERTYKLLKEKDDELLRQLHLAQEVQKGLFPDINKKFEHYEVASSWRPAEQVSGDFLSMWESKKNKYINILIADVTGHGVPSALITMLLKMSLQTAKIKEMSSLEILNKLNNDLHSILSNAAIFVTLLLASIDVETNELKIINCGHPSPIIINENGEINKLEVSGMMLGVVEELDYGEGVIKINEKDLVLFLTDGILEAQSSDQEFFEDSLYDVLKRSKDEEPKEIINNILEGIREFTRTDELQDDVTLSILKRED